MAGTLTAAETAQIAAANASGRQPVVLVHGLWLLAGSWHDWTDVLTREGYAVVAVDWPGDAPDVASARADSSAIAGTSVGDVADHVAEVVSALNRKPALIGHSFGGLLVQMVAGRGLAAATVSIDPAPSRGVLPLPYSTLKSSLPVLGKPSTYRGLVTLTFEQFRYGFANAVPEDEARELYATYHVPRPGRPLFQAATANIHPRTVIRADKRHPERGPMLIIVGEQDHIAPVALARAAYKKQSRNPAPTEFTVIPGAAHSLVIDSRWREVADTAIEFLRRQGI